MEELTLEQWRKLRGLTQEELANKVGISTRSVWNYENDVNYLKNASYDTVSKLATALNIKTSQIFLGKTSDFPNKES